MLFGTMLVVLREWARWRIGEISSTRPLLPETGPQPGADGGLEHVQRDAGQITPLNKVALDLENIGTVMIETDNYARDDLDAVGENLVDTADHVFVKVLVLSGLFQ